jgi:polysaccharide export outer membrane protein
MRTAILSAILAAVPLFCYAGDDPKPKPEQDPQQQAAPPPAIQSPKATIPVGTPNGEQVKSVLPSAAETDPLKMAAPPSPNAAKGAAPSTAAKTYVIGAEDALFITVWQNAALTGSFIVRPDGRISMGLINEVMAAGLTPEQLQNEIVQRLKDGGFLRNPTVTVNVTGFNSKKYFIVGEVVKPGNFPLVVPTTVLEALVNAGGFKDFANKSKIVIQRGTQTFKFNYNRVIAGKDRDTNILLEPGDQIIVK